MSDVVIRAEGLGKLYLIGHHSAERERYTALRDIVGRSLKGLSRSAMDILRGRQVMAGDEVEEFWALKDVSFEIQRGEVVGIIGRNGAGKSTLLKILSRITEPTRGRVEIKGRVASLLEVGTGFHPELTGRENIYLNGAILGMSRAEIRAKFAEIVAFADVERFLDTPVKRYSSGMYVRLAFAVAAHLEPEILVVDEVLAVGDAEFQKKCLGKMQDVASQGRTVVFVSHNMAAVQVLCTKGILLNGGSIARFGSIAETIQEYSSQRTARGGGVFIHRPIGPGLKLISVAVQHAIAQSSDLVVTFDFAALQSGHIRHFALLLYTLDGIRVGILDARVQLGLPWAYTPAYFSISMTVAAPGLVDATYLVGAYIVTDEHDGNLNELAEISIEKTTADSIFIPYDASVRGLIELHGTASVVVNSDTIT